jgi:hypothetical protein
MAAHAKIGPSSSKRWRSCPASIQASVGKSNNSNPASRAGTADHLVSGTCLDNGTDPEAFLGKTVLFYAEIDSPEREREAFAELVDRDTVIIATEIVIDEESVARCASYVNFVREQLATSGGTLYVEQALPIDHITGEADATGTGDAVLISGKQCKVMDAKMGSGRVNAYEVSTPAVIDADTGEILEQAVIEPNSQLAMYASGALRKFDLMGDIETVSLTIVQPKLNHVSEYSMSVYDLNEFVDKLRKEADATRRPDAKFNPTSDNCFFCPARVDCHARQALVLETVLGDFTDLDAAHRKPIVDDDLGTLYEKLDLIREFCKDVEARMYMALDNGKPVARADGTRYKFVTGKRGARQWGNEAQAEALMHEMRIKDDVMYSKKLISPAAAEKFAGPRKPRNSGDTSPPPEIGPVKWKRLQSLIVQAEGKAEIALETDPRPTRHAIDLGFEDLNEKTVVATSTEIDLFN